MTVVERLAQYLEAEGITLSKFTEFTGIPSDRARQWLKGNGNPKAEDERKIEDFIAGKRQMTAHIHGSKSHDLLVQSLQDQITLQKQVIEDLRRQVEVWANDYHAALESAKLEIMAMVKQSVSSGDPQKTIQSPPATRRASRFEERPSGGKLKVQDLPDEQGKSPVKDR
jgi:transcriptional regulator with XRE-family HTH domain